MGPFEWECQPVAEEWLYQILDSYKEKNSFLLKLEKDLLEKTSTRLFDWIDYFVIDNHPAVENDLERSGFTQESATPTYRVFIHTGAKFPSLLVRETGSHHIAGIALKVDAISDFLMCQGLHKPIEGSPLAPLRRSLINKEGGVALYCVERRGTRTMEPLYPEKGHADRVYDALERWKSRPRPLEKEKEALEFALKLAEELSLLLGKDFAAWVVCHVEREFWQSKNGAGQIQKNRQDHLGFGWANHDHHTFRSSREHFVSLVRLFETLGFTCREQYHAGDQSGWGAQIMENSNAGLILFLDVDLSSEEVRVDFAHHPLPESDILKTVGLWCALHGDSILRGGMHHLEAQFEFDSLKNDLSLHGVGLMDPFSNFSYLKQAFTKAEMWKVDPERVEKLVQKGLITHSQADRFIAEGAIGSHMENLQRKEGYKGFNKNNVSSIIQKTDPRSLPG